MKGGIAPPVSGPWPSTGMAFLDLPATPSRGAFLDPLVDLLVALAKRRDAQAPPSSSARVPVAWRPQSPPSKCCKAVAR